MAKIKVHELAKEFGKTNKDVMDFLKSKNIDVKSHMSTVEDKDAEMVRANFRKGNVTAAAMPESEEKPKSRKPSAGERKSGTGRHENGKYKQYTKQT